MQNVNVFFVPVLIALLLLVIICRFNNVFDNYQENFTVATDMVSKINSALDSILVCNQPNAKCTKKNIATFQDFKRYLGLQNFSVLLYLALYNKRVAMKTDLTAADINTIVTSGNYTNSFIPKPAPVQTTKSAPVQTSKSTAKQGKPNTKATLNTNANSKQKKAPA